MNEDPPNEFTDALDELREVDLDVEPADMQEKAEKILEDHTFRCDCGLVFSLEDEFKHDIEYARGRGGEASFDVKCDEEHNGVTVDIIVVNLYTASVSTEYGKVSLFD